MGMTVDHATVQYGDFRGSAAMDSHGGTDVHDMARALGVPERYFPVGLSWYTEWHPKPPGYTGEHIMFITIYAVDTASHGQSADEIMGSLGGKGAIPVKAFNVEMPMSDLQKYIKRFHVVLKSRLFGPDAVFEVEEEGE